MGALQIDHGKVCRDAHEYVLGKLVRGLRIVYRDPEYPDELVIENPDGSRESTHLDDNRNFIKIRDIPPSNRMDPARITEKLELTRWASYRDPEYPGVLVREHRDGRRIIVHVAADGDTTEGREIPPRKDRACPTPVLAPA